MKSTKNWLRCDIPKETAGRFKEYLRDNHIKFEPSENGKDIHFECLMDIDEQIAANLFIDECC